MNASTSTRNTTYDSSESRRSLRDRSPGRYNDPRDSDQYRGSGARGGERRRSISDVRNQNSFASNRDNFRDSRDSRDSRDFPPRDAPRGPKALEPPSGPRSSSYAGDYRGDFGYRGDFRGGRGRGRGRGVWRDDSRDRGREGEREYRPRDDRGPPPFRDDRSRDRDRWDRNDSFRGRRAPSPQGRPRSPNYGSRENRDGPTNLDFDRTQRGSRDGPLSGGSPASDSLQTPGFGRGYGRGRGSRGRGRGGFYDDYVARIPSPDPNFARRTQPSATPPPQVPAFGSTSSNLPLSSVIPKGPKAEMSDATLGPLPGVVVPTAPRQPYGRLGNKMTSSKWTNPEYAMKKKLSDTSPQDVNTSLSEIKPNPPTEPRNSRSPFSISDGKQVESKPDGGLTQDAVNRESHPSHQVREIKSPRRAPRRPRRPIAGKHPVETPVQKHELSEDNSESDSGDEFDDEYFEHEIKKTEGYVDILSRGDWYATTHGHYRQAEEGVADDNWYIKPFVESSIDKHVADQKKEMSNACTAVVLSEGPAPEPKIAENTLSVKPKSRGRSRPNTPLSESDAAAKLRVNGPDPAPQLEPQESPQIRDRHAEPQFAPDIQQTASSSHGELNSGVVNPPIKLETPVKAPTNGRTRKSVPIETFEGSESDPESEPIEPTEDDIQAVRKNMKTPPLSSLPMLNCKPWHQDEEFLKTLEPDPAVTAFIMNKMTETHARKEREQIDEAQRWKNRYFEYRKWTDFSDEGAAARSREEFSRSREKKAAEVTASFTAIPTAGSKPEPQRRTVRRFATDHDIERVLRESEQEAREIKEREERVARAHTASAKEAKIPDMCWNEDERLETAFADRSHLVAFERSFAVLEFGEPIDNFTAEECELFEKAYLETPKQWGKIAESLHRRDYKACIQHYYLVKRTSQLKEKVKKQKKKTRKTTAPKGTKPKSNALIADIVSRDEGEDGAEGDNGGERRRPRRAAAPTFNFEATPGDSEAPSPAPTPGRKPASAPKGDNNGNEPNVPKKRKPRTQGPKQAKSSQLLAAAPSSRVAGSPGLPPNITAGRGSGSIGANPFPPQYDGVSAVVSNFGPQYATPNERASNSMTSNFDVVSQPFGDQERLGSAPPPGFEAQQDRRNLQQTSSYWSVPEQNDFPALLQHFGTDWGAIAKHMTSKTHVMVYTTVFQQWLTIPLDKNKSRRVANILTQVKNYYSRQVESGKMSAWEQIAREADEKKARGESTGPLPIPTPIPKRRFDGPQGPLARSGSAMDIDDIPPPGQNTIMQQASPPQPPLSARFPALAQAGPVPAPTGPPHASSTILSKHIPQQPSQQTPQQMQPQSRHQRGPALGYFNTDPQRPMMQASNTQQTQLTPPMPDSVSQRSLMVAQEAHIERQQALRLEREQAQAQAQAQQIQVQQAQAQAQAQQAHQQVMQKQAMERDRQLQMKQEADPPNPHQYEPYPHPSLRLANVAPQLRPEITQSLSQPDVRRTAPPQQYQPPNHQVVRSLLGDNTSGGRDIKSSPSPALPRAPMSAPPASHEQYAIPPPSRMTPVAAVRQQETVRKTSSIMSLLNDEPSDPRPQPLKRVSDVGATTQMQTTQTPPPQHSLQTSRYSALPQTTSQTPQNSQQMAPMAPQHQLSQPQLTYPPPAQHSLHQHSSSIGQPRSYTPTSFEHRGYAPSPSMQQQQQSMYAQNSRQSIVSQPPPIRREASLGEIHGVTGGYNRTSASSQSSMRLKESPYSAAPAPPTQLGRQQIASPLDPAQPAERDYYSRPQSYIMQQQSSAAGSPQLGPTYHPQAQQQQPNHRQLAFGQGLSNTASPPTSFATQHPLHRSRQNSFDGRYPSAASSAPPPQQGYIQAPQHQGTPLSMQYQQQHPAQDRFESTYERDRERRLLEEQHHQQRLDQHRLDQQRLEHQRLEEQRRRGFQ
ncbi:hypothetical protein D0Z07_5951 [Hyphodiscus hymeniophilus]|uniref:SANT domain-containing protein n=1 Tax=Hyphodiscus hymeniophilus TaxID=353542 RepID=A0A9P7AVY9_9HELO|nr:hypothetical protein D0Z07_5951 [Hyphodiscus hymeniophilus]